MSRIKVDRITDKAGTGAPILVNGMNVTGKSTMGDIVGAAVTFNSITGGSANFSSDVSIGGTLTYEDVKNVDSVGLITARNGIKVTGGTVDVAGTTDGVLNLDTTDSRGAFARFGQGGSYHHMIGCADGLVAGPDKEDLGLRAKDNMVFCTNGANERLRIGSAGQIGIGGANYGSSGEVLTSQGGSAAPQWAPAGGGAWEVINDVSMGADYGSHEIDITGFTTSYTKYVVNFNNLNWVGGGAKKVHVRFYIDGSLYTTGTYAWHDERHAWGSNSSSQGGAYNWTEYPLCSNIASIGWCGELHVHMHMNPTTNPLTPLVTNPQASNDDYFFEDGCKSGSAAGGQITGLKIYNGTDTTNFGLSGRVTTYGLKYS